MGAYADFLNSLPKNGDSGEAYCDELLVMSIEEISGIICEGPDGFGRVPIIARPVPKLI